MLNPIQSFYLYSLHRRLLEEKIRKVSQMVNGKVLDAGSKNRRYDNIFRQAGTIIAVDTNPLRDDILRADIQSLPFEDGEFDTVISFEVLEYVADTRQAIAEIARVLKKGGLFIFSIPFLNPVHGDRIRYTESGLSELLAEDFSLSDCSAFGGRYGFIWDAFFERIRNRGKTLVKVFLYVFLYFTRGVACYLDKREKNSRFPMGYFLVCRRK